MNVAAIQREHEKSRAEEYGVTLFAQGEVIIAGKTHTFQEVIDEDLDNILELQRALHPDPSMGFVESADHFANAAVALRAAQEEVVKDWAKQTAKEMVVL